MNITCHQCDAPFFFQETGAHNKPKLCPQCRQENRKLADSANNKRRQSNARKLGFSSSEMGRIIEPWTIRTHAEVGAILGISAESSRIAERSALAKLRKFFNLDLQSKQPLENSLRKK